MRLLSVFTIFTVVATQSVFLEHVSARESCRMAGQPVVVVAVRNDTPTSLMNQRGFKISTREFCFGGKVYKRSEVRTKAAADGVVTGSCAAMVAGASGLSSGSARGNGC